MRLDRLAGEVIAERFKLREMVGRGGYGAVFEAEQLSVGRRCAVKILLPARADDETVEKRFRAEAKVTSRLTHPNSVVLYDFGVDEATGYLFLATEYLDGVTLDEVLKEEGRLTIERSLGIIGQIAESLADAHEMGLIHRDIKPKNIMLVERANRREFVKVIDFGIAKAMNMTSDLTATGTLIGTPQYMSPEQLLGHELDGRSDQYALAVMGYKMLTGRNPFRAASATDTAINHVHQRPMPLRSYCPGIEVNRDVEDVFLQALEKSPHHRFAHIGVFVTALENALESGQERGGGAMDAGARGEDEIETMEVERVEEQKVEEEESSKEGSDEMMVFETRGFTKGTQLVGDVEELLEEVERCQHSAEEVQVPATASRPASMAETASVEVEAEALEEAERRVAVSTRVAALGIGALAVLVGVMATIAIVGAQEEEGGRQGEEAGMEPVVEVEEKEFEETEEEVETQRLEALSQAQAGVMRGGEAAVGSMAEAAQRLREQREAREREQARASARQREAVERAQGTVVVTMIPWGELVVDGQAKGPQTRQELELDVGQRRLELVQRGEVRASDEVEVRSGERREVVLRVD